MREQSVFYVYALKDPRSSPALPFYIGKGAGTRAWDHELRNDGSAKGERIKKIRAAGLDVLTVKLVEVPTGVRLSTRRQVVIPAGAVEKAQIALEHLKTAVFEATRANKEGLTNYDVANCLGLQSDYRGNSKNYLSYSVLGILMREGKVRRLQNKKHVAAVK